MHKTKPYFEEGSQAVRLPKDCELPNKEVYVKKVGRVVMLIPEGSHWDPFMDAIGNFSDDFMADGRDQGEVQERPPLF